jgi:hypothetical protein
LTPRQNSAQMGPRFEFYMDLLSHDILNSNQAVLSYLELILSAPGLDKKTVAMAEKAIAHVRASTLMIESVKRILGTRIADFRELSPVDLTGVIEKAEADLARFYPGRNIRTEHVAWPRTAMVYGSTFVADLVLSALVTAARLNPGSDVDFRISLVEDKIDQDGIWIVRIEDDDSQLPPFLDGEGVSATYAQDISLAVKTVGLLSAKMIATNLGGDFEAHATSHEPKRRGARFAITLRKADQP